MRARVEGSAWRIAWIRSEVKVAIPQRRGGYVETNAMRMTFRVPWSWTRLPRRAEPLDPRWEMPQRRCLRGDPVPGKVLGVAGNVRHDLEHVVDVALRVRASWDREPNQVRRGRLLRAVRLHPEHHRPDLASTDPSGLVQRHREGLPRVL